MPTLTVGFDPLRCLLGLRDGQPLPLDVQILAEHEPQAALARAWALCVEPGALLQVLDAAEVATHAAWCALSAAYGTVRRGSERAAVREARACAAIRAAVARIREDP